MQIAPINAEKYKLQRPDGFPADWDNDITAWGVSRNTASGHYVVKLSVAGTQFFLGNAYSQPTAAKLYDYAAWKFAGKMPRTVRVNFPSEFHSITQADIDRDWPRLNELYLKIPFISTEDATKPEAELRAARIQHQFVSPLKAGGGAKDYFQVVLGRLKRLRLHSNESFEHVTEWHSKLGMRKVPELYNRFAALEQKYADLSKNLLDLEAAMESNHDYYRMVKYGTEI